MKKKKPTKKEEVKDQTPKKVEPETVVETDDSKSEEEEVKEDDLLKGTPFKSVEELKKSWQASQEEGQKVGTALNQIKERASTDPDLNAKLADVFGIPRLEQPQEEIKEEPSEDKDEWVEKKKAEEAKREQIETDAFVQEHKKTFFTDGGVFNQEEWKKVANLYPIVVQSAELNNEMLSTKEALDRALYFSQNPKKETKVNPQEREAEYASQSTGATGSTPKREVKLTEDQKWVADKFGMTHKDYLEGIKKE